MYQVECIFKGYAKKSELLTKIPINFIKNPDIFVQEFKVVTEENPKTDENTNFQYYGELGILLVVEQNNTLIKLLEEISKTINELVAKNKVKIISTDIGFEFYENGEPKAGKHLFTFEEEQ
ncbi:hypothetical protein [Thermosyntropha sp.]|uniref:hypothetical protein n=1 Tax=Thermosyntropha sp. TaxID=2740820 RepID=UPI0025F65D42|nr:hypothetical protein [Thermosyntropha sp.]MBO8158089.1 hypothetical protein [Thermosyntropha sp.]